MKLWELAGAEDDRLFSPYCWRVRMALAHKGLAAESVPWRFTEKSVIAATGQGAVPVLEDGTNLLHDSWTIAQHLEKTRPGQPLFAGASGQSLAFFFKHWVERTVHLPMLKVVIVDIHRHLHASDQAYFRASREKRFGQTLEAVAGDTKAAVAALSAALDPLRPVIVQHPFVSGATPGFADYVLFSAFQWARVVSPTRLLEPDDPLFGWRERMLDLFDGLA
ncbi:MAG: glutathione S-transferase N-terminal domain-containing protein, partial [Proteobacteria bacterium]|nr:glutathione S-transferase N-terminal domain-containing protein [Pseudomonadota bacterium]